jgi:hypothetical protein
LSHCTGCVFKSQLVNRKSAGEDTNLRTPVHKEIEVAHKKIYYVKMNKIREKEKYE